MGCDVRILQLEGAKDPDEYVIKYGSGKFQKAVGEAISLIEYKTKLIKKDLNMENANDKIKFLNEIANLLSKMDNKIEMEIYVDKIAKEYQISKEAIYAQINKLNYATKQGGKLLEKKMPIAHIQEKKGEEISKEQLRTENTVIFLLVQYQAYPELKDVISPGDFKLEENKIILQKLYEEFEKGNSNIKNVLELFQEEKVINHLTEILMTDFGITEKEKSIKEIKIFYQREKKLEQKNVILRKLENDKLDIEERKQLEKQLNEIIIELAKKRI